MHESIPINNVELWISKIQDTLKTVLTSKILGMIFLLYAIIWHGEKVLYGVLILVFGGVAALGLYAAYKKINYHFDGKPTNQPKAAAHEMHYHVHGQPSNFYGDGDQNLFPLNQLHGVHPYQRRGLPQSNSH